jgi:hypothetical protein
MFAVVYSSTRVEAQNVAGLSLQVYREGGRTPLIFIEVDATAASAQTVLLYGATCTFCVHTLIRDKGHMDKQPPFQGWLEVTGLLCFLYYPCGVATRPAEPHVLITVPYVFCRVLPNG